MWDADAVHRLAARQVQVARDAGALVHLEFALSFLARSHMLAGDLTAATLMLDEADLIAEATRNPALVNLSLIHIYPSVSFARSSPVRSFETRWRYRK